MGSKRLPNEDEIVVRLRALSHQLREYASVADGAALLIESLRGEVVRAHAFVASISARPAVEDAGPRPAFRLYRRKEVMAMTGLSRASIYLQMKAGTFPQSIAIGPGSVAWDEADLLTWLALKAGE